MDQPKYRRQTAVLRAVLGGRGEHSSGYSMMEMASCGSASSTISLRFTRSFWQNCSSPSFSLFSCYLKRSDSRIPLALSFPYAFSAPFPSALAPFPPNLKFSSGCLPGRLSTVRKLRLDSGLMVRERVDVMVWLQAENCLVLLACGEDRAVLSLEFSQPLSVKGSLLAVRATTLRGMPSKELLLLMYLSCSSGDSFTPSVIDARISTTCLCEFLFILIILQASPRILAQQGRKGGEEKRRLRGGVDGKDNINCLMQGARQLRKESNDWLDDEPRGQPSPVRCQKQSPKSPATTPLEKTQRIKKPKKDRKPSREQPKEQPSGASLEDRLLGEAVQRLRRCGSSDSLPIYKKLTRERLLQFLETIETEYSHVVSLYLHERRGESSGGLKGLFLRFIDAVIAAFPVLNNIVFQYAFQYYATGPLQPRFSRLMDRNITPILKLMSEKYNKMQPPTQLKYDSDQSTHFSHSPERQHLEDFESLDTRKSEKRRRQRNRKKEEQQAEDALEKELPKEVKPASKPKEQIDRDTQQLIGFLENLSIEKD